MNRKQVAEFLREVAEGIDSHAIPFEVIVECWPMSVRKAGDAYSYSYTDLKLRFEDVQPHLSDIAHRYGAWMPGLEPL